MNPTRIAYLTRTWPVSSGCLPELPCWQRCWARGMAHRFHRDFAPTFHPERLDEPLRARKPQVIGVSFGGDLFCEGITDDQIAQVFGVMAAAPQHTFVVLTKRVERMARWFSTDGLAKHVDLMRNIAAAGRIAERFAIERTVAIDGWPGYFITSYGRVLSDKLKSGGIWVRSQDRHELVLQPNESGHCRVTLYRDGVSERPLVHRLVLSAFDREPIGEEECCHIDSNPMNNSLWNLRWGTMESNWSDRYRNGTRRTFHKLSWPQVEEIRRRLAEGASACSLAPHYGVSDTQIRNIATEEQWAPEYSAKWPLRGVWIGTSAATQSEADERIPLLLQVPAAHRWISAEPLLSDLRLKRYLTGCPPDCIPYGYPNTPLACLDVKHGKQPPCYPRLDYVVAAAESGPGARPMDVAWARSLKAQCDAAGVSFALKDQVHFLTLDGQLCDAVPFGAADGGAK